MRLGIGMLFMVVGALFLMSAVHMATGWAAESSGRLAGAGPIWAGLALLAAVALFGAGMGFDSRGFRARNALAGMLHFVSWLAIGCAAVSFWFWLEQIPVGNLAPNLLWVGLGGVTAVIAHVWGLKLQWGKP